jgi:hypothetical protein
MLALLTHADQVNLVALVDDVPVLPILVAIS